MSWVWLGVCLMFGVGMEALPRGHRSICRATQQSPGVWNFTCPPPADEKITLNLEHVVQFKNSDLTGQLVPQQINVDVPNYKIRQVIRPQIVDDDGVNATALEVNIQLLSPEVQTDRQEELPSTLRGPPLPHPSSMSSTPSCHPFKGTLSTTSENQRQERTRTKRHQSNHHEVISDHKTISDHQTILNHTTILDHKSIFDPTTIWSPCVCWSLLNG